MDLESSATTRISHIEAKVGFSSSASTVKFFYTLSIAYRLECSGIGSGVGTKDDVGIEYDIAFVSMNNNNAEFNYSSYNKEALAAVWAIAHFQPHLYRQRLTLVTDH